MPTPPRRRLAIIGGGMGGVSTAYFCDSEWATDLFEARSHLGGNATTLVVDDDGHEVSVDIGAESFNPATHPLYWAVLQEIGARAAAHDVLVEMPGTLAVFDAATRRPLFVSSRPLRTPGHAVDFFRFARAAREFAAGDPRPDVTVGDWVDGLPLSDTFARSILLPWLASLTCFSVEDVRKHSLHSFLLLFVGIFPANVLVRPKTYCSRIGLGGVLQLLVDRCRNLTVRTDAPVLRVEQTEGSWFVETRDGRFGPYDAVVVNAPPHASREFLTDAPDALRAILARHEYYSTRMLIHRDPVFMPADRRFWSTHNAAVDGDSCEATIWLGAFRTHRDTGKPVRLFKSWATRRSVQPDEILAERTFLHPALTPATLRATRELAEWQGTNGLFFAGHFTTLTDLQETALSSGAAVARVLTPDDPRVLSLERRARDAGSAQLGHDVQDAAATAS